MRDLVVTWFIGLLVGVAGAWIWRWQRHRQEERPVNPRRWMNEHVYDTQENSRRTRAGQTRDPFESR
jgi:hypothetical protein